MLSELELESARQELRDATAALDAAETIGEPARLSQALAQVSRPAARITENI